VGAAKNNGHSTEKPGQLSLTGFDLFHSKNAAA
jgi:hypothetical protein